MFSKTTGLSPFFANYSFYLRLGVELIEPVNMPATRQASAFANQMSAIQDHLREQTTLAQAHYKEAVNRSCATALRYDVNQMVWLSTKNLKTLYP
jgi:hypothetical protein